MTKITIAALAQKKSQGIKISMTTAYSFNMARLVDGAGVVDMILVSDRLGPIELGYESPLIVTLEEMLHHTKAVARAKPRALVVAQLPYLTYEISPMEAARNAGRLYKEGSADGVMITGAAARDSLKAIVEANVPVMGRLTGLLKTAKPLKTLLESARLLEKAGCFALLLEEMAPEPAQKIRRALSIPVISTGRAAVDGWMAPSEKILGLSPKQNSEKPRATFAAQAVEIFRSLAREYQQ